MNDDTMINALNDSMMSDNFRMNIEDRAAQAELFPSQQTAQASTQYVIPFIAPPKSAKKIWLLSFNDLMGILLTFFVLLYSMSEPASKKDDIKNQAVQPLMEMNQFLGTLHNAGDKDVISLNRTDYNRSLEIGYLKSILENLRDKNESLKDLSIKADAKNRRLILSLPQDILFSSGATGLNNMGIAAVKILGGALAGIKNGITVVGHTDPNPPNDGRNNWQISLERAVAVADILKQTGYARSIPVQGYASGLYTQLPETLSKSDRDRLSRRVDVIIYDHDGSLQKRFGIAGN